MDIFYLQAVLELFWKFFYINLCLLNDFALKIKSELDGLFILVDRFDYGAITFLGAAFFTLSLCCSFFFGDFSSLFFASLN